MMMCWSYWKDSLRVGKVLVGVAATMVLSVANGEESDVETVKEVLMLPVDISSAPRPVGSGARALGMSAFTAIADDATAASWNPAALIQLVTPEISGVMSYLSRSEDFSSSEPGFDVAAGDMTSTDLNYLSAVLPFAILRKNFVASINLQHVYSFDRRLHYTYASRSRTVETDESMRTAVDMEEMYEVAFEQDGSIYALTPALAYQISPRLSIGAALNFYRSEPTGGNAFTETTHMRTQSTVHWRVRHLDPKWGEPMESGSFFEESELTELKEFSGVEGVTVTLGVLWNATEGGLTLGLTADLPYTLDLRETITLAAEPARVVEDGEVTFYPSRYEDLPPVETNVEYDFPLTLGLGAAYRFSDAFTIAADVGWTNWADFIFRKEDGTEVNPINRDTAEDDGKLDLVEDTWAARLGAEYFFIFEKIVIALRSGVFLEQQPGVDEPEDIYGASFGTGITVGSINFDVAYQARFGNGVLKGVFPDMEGTDADTVEHLVFASVIVHF